MWTDAKGMPQPQAALFQGGLGVGGVAMGAITERIGVEAAMGAGAGIVALAVAAAVLTAAFQRPPTSAPELEVT